MTNKLIILVGLPGSGKTTLARNSYNNGFAILNQDIANGGRQILESMLRKEFLKGKNVVLDRCNLTPAQRKPFINIAKEFNAKVVVKVLIISPRICKERIRTRTDHETINPDMDWVVNRFMTQNQRSGQTYPEKKEGIDRIEKLYWCRGHNIYHKYVCNQK